jgi:hypothetical protein
VSARRWVGRERVPAGTTWTMRDGRAFVIVTVLRDDSCSFGAVARNARGQLFSVWCDGPREGAEPITADEIPALVRSLIDSGEVLECDACGGLTDHLDDALSLPGKRSPDGAYVARKVCARCRGAS